MTVTTTNTTNQYTGNGTTNVFNITFQFWDDADIEVYLRTIATGAEVLQTLSTHYTISGGDGSTGSITFDPTNRPAATDLTSATEIHIRRNTVTTQQFDFTPSTVFPSADTERALDRAAMRDQEDRADFLDRAIRNPVTDKDPSTGAPDMTLPSSALRASKYLYFDADGKPTAAALTTATATVTAAGAALIDDADAAAQRTTLSVPENAGDVPKIQAGLVAARPAAGTFGKGIWVTTDAGSEAVYYSDNSSWVEVAAEMGVQPSYAFASIPTSAAANANKIYFDTDNNVLRRDSGSAVTVVDAPWPRGTIGGLSFSMAAASVLTLQPGEARLGTAVNRSTQNAKLSSAIIGDMSGAAGWTAGSGIGVSKVPTGVTIGTDSIYALFLIAKSDGSVDMGIDTMANADDASTLMADSTLVAAGFNTFRRIGWLTTNTSNTHFLDQQTGDFCWLKEGPRSALYLQNQNFAGVVQSTLAYCPPRVVANLRFAANLLTADGPAVGGAWLIGPGDSTVPEPDSNQTLNAASTAPGNLLYKEFSDSLAQSETFQMFIDTNRTVDIHTNSGAGTTSDIEIMVDSWWDQRDKDL